MSRKNSVVVSSPVIGKNNGGFGVCSVLLCLLVFAAVLLLYFGGWRSLILGGGFWGWLVFGYCVVSGAFLIFRLVWGHRYYAVSDGGFRPKVSVVISMFNEAGQIVHAVNSVLGSDYPRNKLELVVVDDGSTDGSLEVVNKLCRSLRGRFKVVSMGVNGGKRLAVAAGVRECTGDVVVLMDSDAVVEVDAIRLLVQPLVDTGVFAVCGNAVVANEFLPRGKGRSFLARLQKVWYADAFRLRKGVESQLGMVLCCSGVLSAYRMDRFVEVVDEWVNDKFLGRPIRVGDDRHLTNLMLRLGGKTVFQSNAKVYTVAPCSVKTFFRQQVRWARGSIWGTMFAATFFSTKTLGQKLLFWLLTLATFITPFAFIGGVAGLVLFGGLSSFLLFCGGLFVVSLLFALTDKLLVEYFTPVDFCYRLLLPALMIPTGFVYIYGWLTPHKAAVWGTR